MLLEGWEFESLTGSGEVQLPNFEALVLWAVLIGWGNSVRFTWAFMQGEVAWFPQNRKPKRLLGSLSVRISNGLM